MCLCFPFYNEPEEEILTYFGQFYTKANHFKPKEILVPDEFRLELGRRTSRSKGLKATTRAKKGIGSVS